MTLIVHLACKKPAYQILLVHFWRLGFTLNSSSSIIIIIIIIIITDEYDLGGTVALLLQDHLTLLVVSHVTTNQSTTA